MALIGDFKLVDYLIGEDGKIRVHFYNAAPGGGNFNDAYAVFDSEELPGNMSQNQLANALKTRLNLQNLAHASLNTAMNNEVVITLP